MREQPKNSQRSRPATPGGVLVRCFVLGLLLWFTLPWLIGLIGTSGRAWYGKPPPQARAQLRSIRHRLAQGEAEKMAEYFPEGELFSYSFYGFTLVNMALAQPEDGEFIRMARHEVERLIPIVESLAEEEPFTESAELVPKGGIIPAGHANLLRAGYVLLGVEEEEIANRFHEQSALLYEEFMKSKVASLETYPQMIWPVDSACALESLRLHDEFFGTRYSEACERWEEWMLENLDEESGMMPAQVGISGGVLESPRGCALSWSLAFMPGFAPNLAQQQYQRYRDNWFIHFLGMTGIREWPPGKKGSMDADTGPIVGGAGFAATGFGTAAAKANGDVDNLRGVLRAIELLGLPVRTIRGEKEYFLGRVLLADVLVLWGKTVRVWGIPRGKVAAPGTSESARSGFWIVVLAAAILMGLIIWIVLRDVLRACRNMERDPDRWTRKQEGILVFDALVLLAWVAVPALFWFHTLLLLGLADIVEQRFLTAPTSAKLREEAS